VEKEGEIIMKNGEKMDVRLYEKVEKKDMEIEKKRMKIMSKKDKL
jgi:hypothetical protein